MINMFADGKRNLFEKASRNMNISLLYSWALNLGRRSLYSLKCILQPEYRCWSITFQLLLCSREYPKMHFTVHTYYAKLNDSTIKFLTALKILVTTYFFHKEVESFSYNYIVCLARPSLVQHVLLFLVLVFIL